MRDLYSINTELMEIQRVMGAYRLEMSNKEEKLRRLQQALSDLEMIKSDFLDKKELCLKPEFTSATLCGDNAKVLEMFKKHALQRSFVSIPNNEISQAERAISREIDRIKWRISSLENSISSLQTQHTNLSAEKMKVARNP